MRQLNLLAILCGLLAAEGGFNRDVEHLRRVHQWQAASDFIGLVWSRDGQKIATHSNWGRTYTIYTADGAREREFDGEPDLPLYGNSIAFLEGGRLLLTPHARKRQASERWIFSVWDIAQNRIIREVPGPFPQKAIQSNGAFIFAVDQDESAVAVVSSLLPNQSVTLYSTKTWEIIRQFPIVADQMHSSSATSLAFSPDGKRLAIGRLDGAVDLYDLNAKDSPKKVLTGYDPRMTVPIGALAFSPDGKFLAGGAGLTINAYKSLPSLKLWRLSDLTLVDSALPTLMPIRQISWSRDGRYVALAAGDHTVRLGSPVVHPKDGWTRLPFAKPILSLAFSPHQDVLAVASGSILELLALPE